MRSALNFPLVSYFHIYSLSKANNRQQQQTAHHSRSSVVGNYYFIYLTIKETTDSISPSSVVRTVMLVVPVFNIVCIGVFFVYMSIYHHESDEPFTQIFYNAIYVNKKHVSFG